MNENEVGLGNVERSDVALLVIDVQRGLFERSTPIYEAQQLLDNIEELLWEARTAGAAVFFIQHANMGSLKRGTDAWRLHPQIRPLAHEPVIHKHHGNAFKDTDLHASLQAQSVRRLVVTGLVTRGCVRATVQGALDLGYDVVLVADGHSSYAGDAASRIGTWNAKLQALGAEVVPAAQVDFT
jgi:nicotinamidase-related amidase